MEKLIIDQETMKRTLRRLSYEIIEKNHNVENLVLLGIEKKGVPLATIIQENISHIEGVKVPCFPLNILPYRDDIESNLDKGINKENVTLDLTEKTVILVDDVLFTGRTVRAAMDAVIDLGRPFKIQLAVLVDRGHRQLPVTANYIGKNIPTSLDETILVSVSETEANKVVLLK